MGDIRKPILILVACALALAALVGFVLGFTQSDRKFVPGEQAPIAANLPANVVIKDAQPLAPPPPPPPKPKAQDETAASDQAESDIAPPVPVEAPPPGPPPSLPGGPLPADLPPT
jgi:hypothetical protein